MNKKQYLDALEKELRQSKVADVEDVLADYEAHFTRKTQDGYTEDEVARKLGTPQEIAADFLPDPGGKGGETASGSRAMRRIGLCLGDLFALPVFLILYAWAIAMLAVSAAVFALGGYICLGLNLLSFIPVLTTAGGILMGLGIVAVAVLLFAASVWFMLLAAQMTRAYMRWHGNRWFGRHELSLAMTPQMTGKKRRVLRSVVLVSLISFILLFVAGFIVLSIQAGTLGFWHHWHWFEPAENIAGV